MPDEEVTLRLARPEDADAVFAWANDPSTRAASFSSAPIAPEEHRRWYEATLRGARALHIVEIAGAPIGVARLDPLDGNTAEVSISLDAAQRGRGLAAPALRALIPWASEAGWTTLVARVRADNEPSRRLFERAGFSLLETETIRGVEALRFSLALAGRGDREQATGDREAAG